MKIGEFFVEIISFTIFLNIEEKYLNLLVVAYQCSISNVMYTGDIEALFALVHAVLDC